MTTNQWLMDAIKEMEDYSRAYGLHGLTEGLGDVLAIYASEAMKRQEKKVNLDEMFRK